MNCRISTNLFFYISKYLFTARRGRGQGYKTGKERGEGINRGKVRGLGYTAWMGWRYKARKGGGWGI